MKVIRNIIVGAIGILVCNRILAPFDIFIGINLLSLGTVGLLGFPGFVMLMLFSIFL